MHHFLAQFVEYIDFKQVVFGSFYSTTNAKQPVYGMFRMKIMVILRAAICESSMVYLASAFAVDIKQGDITKCNQGRVESALKSAFCGILRQCIPITHELMVDR